ncbi:hypothetical protein CDD82_1687 [Ophiocordyceps australis]|uniref:RRM domain-containing protein n=1 Tax=Ophiocordyceps australis TaxID=1399860 RepID=A0A2C5XXV9_9HYPO|nr:hypothetical protein CDD82_1687 [Ophiocordyceps australis]
MATIAPARGLAPNASLPAKVQPLAPNQTLYVANLPSSKIQKADLRTALYMLFSTYGSVLDVVALKTIKMRGQAHVTFKDIQTATQAMRHLNGQMFLGHELKIEYAKSKSDFVAKLDGTFTITATPIGAAAAEQTELQKSIFDAPVPGPASTAAKVDQPSGNNANSDNKESSMPEARGQKRPREEEKEDSDEDVAMEEDSDDE